MSAERVAGTWRLSTGQGTGAVAVFEIRAPALEMSRKLGLGAVGPGDVRLRNFAGIDTGLVARVGDGMLLLTTHGGPEVVRRVCSWLEAAGLEEDAGDEYPEARSGFESRLLATLARAASPAAIDVLLAQPARWRASGLPDPPAETPAPDPGLGRLLDRLIRPPLVVAIGASNIGKSTLLNRLAGRSVAIVADEPGTTRDHVGALVDFDGVLARYVDTPGMRSDAGAVEARAASLAAGVTGSADLILRLGDAGSEPPGGWDRVPSLRIALRADLGLPAWEHDAAVSALRGEGVEDCRRLIGERLVPSEARRSGVPWRFWGSVRG